MKTKDEETCNEKRTEGTLAGWANNIGKIVSDVSSKTIDVVVKTQDTIVKAVDRNEDGKINLKDFGIEKSSITDAKEKVQQLASETSQQAKTLASKTNEKVRVGSEKITKTLEDAKIEIDKKSLRPVFAADLPSSTSNTVSTNPVPSMICIVDRDKKRSESDACRGAIGYWTTVKGMDILNIYEDSAQDHGIVFYPNISKTIYYIDPYQASFYISLDEYFAYLKKARVSELMMIAQDLGAKSVKITLKEIKKTFVGGKADLKAKLGAYKGEGSYEKSNSNYSSVEIAGEVKFSGHRVPVTPKLVYFKNESDIENLIKMCMDKENKIELKTYTLQFNKTSGIKEKEAVTIDAVLSQLKCSGTASISSEAQLESRIVLEYTIAFEKKTDQ